MKSFSTNEEIIQSKGGFGGGKINKAFVSALLLLSLSIWLVGCSSSEKKPEAASSGVQQEDPQASDAPKDVKREESIPVKSQPDEDEANKEDPPAPAPVECEGILFETGAVIEGKKLGNCMVAAMMAAGTGTHRVETIGEPATVVDFKWDPDYSMNVVEGPNSVIIQGKTGWYKNDAGKWIQEDDQSIDPDVALANNIIKMVRVFSNPIVLRDYLALSPTWTVVGEELVPAADAITDKAWHLVPEGPIKVDMVTLSDVGLWLTPNYLGAYYVATSSAMGVTATTSNTFLQWGEKVDIPTPKGKSK